MDLGGRIQLFPQGLSTPEGVANKCSTPGISQVRDRCCTSLDLLLYIYVHRNIKFGKLYQSFSDHWNLLIFVTYKYGQGSRTWKIPNYDKGYCLGWQCYAWIVTELENSVFCQDSTTGVKSSWRLLDDNLEVNQQCRCLDQLPSWFLTCFPQASRPLYI